MLEARLSQGSLLKKLFEAIREMVSDVNLECDESGMSMQSMDSSHVALVSFKLNDSLFDTYRCDISRSLGLNMTSVCRVFKMCGTNDSVTIRCEDEGDTIQFIIENDRSDKMSHVELKLMQIDTDSLGVPESEFDCVAIMPAKELASYARIYAEMNDSITISVDKNEIRLICRGDVGGGSTIFKPTDSENKDELVQIVTCKKPTSLQFALRYINNFAKAQMVGASVKLSLTEQSPLEVRYLLNENDESVGFLRFFLAPKMEEADDSMET
eukprot:GHVQ01020321.1.p1 GENE.GHVQ01020321.1~~GHVQ01020321.1.p1  ORF type:complete len:269 (-),score=45.15 GHVQ01020321.1:481-1287(-)